MKLAGENHLLLRIFASVNATTLTRMVRLQTSPTDSDDGAIALTTEQMAALDALQEFVTSTEKLYLLTGYAGTGKTTLLQVFINGLREQGDDRKIVLSAFSNKATKVLAKMAVDWQLNVDAMTCCTLLGLRPVINEDTGNQEFQLDRKQGSQVDRFSLVIVDECSMVNEELWRLLVSAVSNLYGS
ncbi:MAG: AAA family ATPase, partial [Cyanobacteria bacterium P01_D01_bin.6]